MRFVPLVSIGVLIACSGKVDDETPGITSARSFEVGKVTAVAVQPRASRASWGDFKDMGRIDLVACLKTRGINTPILEDRFIIHTPEEKLERESDGSDGCLRWSLLRRFDFLAAEHYQRFSLRIEGVGRHKGEIKIPLGINPWADASNAVKDLRPEHERLSLKDFAAPIPMEEGTLEVVDLQLARSEGHMPAGDQYQITYDFSAQPRYRRRGLDGAIIASPFTEGRFRVVLTLLARQAEGAKKRDKVGRVEIARTQGIFTIERSALAGPVTFSIARSHWPHKNAVLETMIELTPLGAPSSLDGFRGIVGMKDLSGNNHTLPLALPSPGFAPAKEFPIHWNDGSAKTLDDFAFAAETIKAEWGSFVGENYKTNSRKTLRLPLRVQLANAHDPAALDKTGFQITVLRADKEISHEVSTTDSKGNLETWLSVDFDEYDCRRWIPLTVRLQALDGQLAGAIKERRVAVNPHNPNHFFYDIDRQGPPPELPCKKPQIHLNSIGYQPREVDRESFLLDKYLNLSLRKFYRFRFSPQLKTLASHRREGQDISPILYGKFHLRLDLYSPKTDRANYEAVDFADFTYITSAEQEVSVNEGVVDVKVPMSFNVGETLALSYECLMVLRLTPIGDTSLMPGDFHFRFHGYRSAESVHRLADYRLAQRHEPVLRQIRRMGLKIPPAAAFEGKNPPLPSPLELYKQYLVDVGQSRHKETKTLFFSQEELADKISLSAGDFNRLARNSSLAPAQTLGKLCPLFYSDPERKEDLKSCRREPGKHIERLPVAHIVQVVSMGKVESQAGEVLSIPKARFAKDESGRFNQGRRFAASFGFRSAEMQGDRYFKVEETSLNLGIQSAPFVYWGLARYNMTGLENFERTHRSRMSTAFSFRQSDWRRLALSFNALRLEFDALIKPCFSAASKTYRNVFLQLHVCGEDHYAKIQENWYYMADTARRAEDVLADFLRPSSTSRGPVIIRGGYNFKRYWERFQERDILSLKQDFVSSEDATNLLLSQLQERKSFLLMEPYTKDYTFFPGLLVPTTEDET